MSRRTPPFTKEMREQAKKRGDGLFSLCVVRPDGASYWVRGPATKRERQIMGEAADKLHRYWRRRRLKERQRRTP